jgi:integrase
MHRGISLVHPEKDPPMPPPVKVLTENELRSLKPAARPYRRFAGDGLYIEVSPAGSRLWRLKYRFAGKEKRIALGTYPDTTLKMARQRAADARNLVFDGKDPGEARRQEKSEAKRRADSTVAAAAAAWIAANKVQWAASTHDKAVRRVERFILPGMGKRPLESVTTRDCADVIRGVAALNLKDTPIRVARDLSSIFAHAVHQGLLTGSPALSLSKVVPKVPKRHFAATVDPADFAHVVRLIDQHRGGVVVHSLLRLMLYVPLRPGELRTLQWADLDLGAAMISLPAERMKSRRPFLMPLSAQAVHAFTELQQHTGTGTFVFPGHRDRRKPLSDAAAGAAMRALGIDTQDQFTGHGIRAVFRTIGRERLGIAADVLEAHLAHQPAGPLGAAYDRTLHLAERRQVAQAWADFVDSLRTGTSTGNVLAFKGKAA